MHVLFAFILALCRRIAARDTPLAKYASGNSSGSGGGTGEDRAHCVHAAHCRPSQCLMCAAGSTPQYLKLISRLIQSSDSHCTSRVLNGAVYGC